MGLAEGTSRMACQELSLHSETMIELLRQFIPHIEIQVDVIDEKKNTLVTVKGEGFAPCL